MPSTIAAPSSTYQAAASVSSPSNSVTVPSALKVSSITMPNSVRLYSVPSISMLTPLHVPRKGSPSAPTGRAGAGVAVGSGVGMGAHFTAASSASTSGSCAGSVMQSS